MPSFHKTSPARSQDASLTRRKSRMRTLSVGSPARSNTSGRLTSIIDDAKKKQGSFVLSPLSNRKSILTDNTFIDKPGRTSWWKKLGDNSRDVIEVLNSNEAVDPNNVIEEYVDVLSQEKKHYTLDLPESSDNESINSIVVPQRRLFNQQSTQNKNNYGQIIGNRDTLAKINKTNNDLHDKSVKVAPKNLFNLAPKRARPAFPEALLTISPNKTIANKTKEIAAADVKGQVRTLFGNRPGTKRKNMFVDFIVSESEDEISDIQPRVFRFPKMPDDRRRPSTSSRGTREPSPTSSIATDIEMDDWKLLPSSTMVDNQIEEIMMASTPVKRARLSKFSEATESVNAANATANKTKVTNKSFNSMVSEGNKHSVATNSKQALSNTIAENKIEDMDINTETVKQLSFDNSRNVPINKTKVINKSLTSNNKSSSSTIKNRTITNIQLADSCKDENTQENKQYLEANSVVLQNQGKEMHDAEDVEIAHSKSKTREIGPHISQKSLLEVSKGKRSAGVEEAKQESLQKCVENEHNLSVAQENIISSALQDEIEQDSEDDTKLEFEDDDEPNETENHKSKHALTEDQAREQDREVKQDNTIYKLENTKLQLNQTKRNNTITEAIQEVEESLKQDKNEGDNYTTSEKDSEIHRISEKNKQVKSFQSLPEDNEKGEYNVSSAKNLNSNKHEQSKSQCEDKNIEALQQDEQIIEQNNKQVEQSVPKNNKQAVEQSIGEEDEQDEYNKAEDTEQDTVEQSIGKDNEQDNENSAAEDNEQDAAEQSVVEDNEQDAAEHSVVEDIGQDATEQSIVEDNEQDAVKHSDKEDNGQDADEQSDEEENEQEAVEQSFEEENDQDEDRVSEDNGQDAVEQSDEEENEQDAVEQSVEEENEQDAVEQSVEEENDQDEDRVAEDNGQDAVEQSDEEHEQNTVEQSVEEENDQDEDRVAEDAVEQSIEDDNEQDEDENSVAEDNEQDATINESKSADEQNNESDVEEDLNETGDIDASVEQIQEDEELSEHDVSEELNESDNEQSDQNDTEGHKQGEDKNASAAQVNASKNKNQSLEQNEVSTSNTSHDTTGRHRNKKDFTETPEAVLQNMTNKEESFLMKGRNTSIRKTKSMIKQHYVKPSLVPARDSTGFSDGTKNSSAEGSGWDSHRTTRKTIRQTMGKDFSPRKSLRTLVMEKSAKRFTAMSDLNDDPIRVPQAHSTQYPEPMAIDEDEENDNPDSPVSDHEVSKKTRQATLEMYLQSVKKKNQLQRQQIEEEVKNSLKNQSNGNANYFKMPSKSSFTLKHKMNSKGQQNKPKAKVIKSTIIPLEDLPVNLLEDMKYKPPKRYQPSNASWITKRLYNFFERKLEAKYDYEARIHAEKLVEKIYTFTKDLRRHPVAPKDAIAMLKREMATLNIVQTHLDFYNFFHEYMPREVRVKVVPDLVNKISPPKRGVFADILST